MLSDESLDYLIRHGRNTPVLPGSSFTERQYARMEKGSREAQASESWYARNKDFIDQLEADSWRKRFAGSRSLQNPAHLYFPDSKHDHWSTQYMNGAARALLHLAFSPLELVEHADRIPAAFVGLVSDPKARQAVVDAIAAKMKNTSSAGLAGELTVEIPTTVLGVVGAGKGVIKGVNGANLVLKGTRAEFKRLSEILRAPRGSAAERAQIAANDLETAERLLQAPRAGRVPQQVQSMMTELGRRGGQQITKAELDAVESILIAHGVKVERGLEKITGPGGVNAGAMFTANKSGPHVLQVKKNATKYEVFHELSHWADVYEYGYTAYAKLTPQLREMSVYNRMINDPDIWNSLTSAEKADALRQITQNNWYKPDVKPFNPFEVLGNKKIADVNAP